MSRRRRTVQILVATAIAVLAVAPIATAAPGLRGAKLGASANAARPAKSERPPKLWVATVMPGGLHVNGTVTIPLRLDELQG